MNWLLNGLLQLGRPLLMPPLLILFKACVLTNKIDGSEDDKLVFFEDGHTCSDGVELFRQKMRDTREPPIQRETDYIGEEEEEASGDEEISEADPKSSADDQCDAGFDTDILDGEAQ